MPNRKFPGECLTSEDIEGYLRKTCAEEDRSMMEDHLALCEKCRANLSLTRQRLRIGDRDHTPSTLSVAHRDLLFGK
jgi:predicted anti-sigma-YlaC factor YlaD